MGLILYGNLNVEQYRHCPLSSKQHRIIKWTEKKKAPQTGTQCDSNPGHLDLKSVLYLLRNNHSLNSQHLNTHKDASFCKTYLTKFLPAWFCHPQSQRWTDLERCSEAESFCRQLGTPLVRGRRRHRHRRRIGWLAPDLRCPGGPKFFGMCPFPVHFDGVGLVL